MNYEIVCKIQKESKAEHAGKRYEELLMKQQGISCSTESKEPIESNEVESQEDSDFSKKFKPQSKMTKKGDYYSILGLGTVRYEATDDDIKTACLCSMSFM